jgi:hypothetical protein
MSAAPKSKYPVLPLRDLIMGDEGRLRYVMRTGPLRPRVDREGGLKDYGSKALKAEGEPNVALLSFGDLNRDGTIDYPSVPTIPYSPYIHEYVIRPKDILFRSRGFAGSAKVSIAAYIDREIHDEALRVLRKEVSQVHFAFDSSLIRIRLQEDGCNDAPRLDPEYLAAYVNSAGAQRHLTRRNQGGIVVGVSKSDLLALPVVVPPLEDQQRLVQLMRARADYARVSQRLSECYGFLADQALKLS